MRNGGRCRHRPPLVPALTAVAGWRGHLSLGGFGKRRRRSAARFPSGSGANLSVRSAPDPVAMERRKRPLVPGRVAEAGKPAAASLSEPARPRPRWLLEARRGKPKPSSTRLFRSTAPPRKALPLPRSPWEPKLLSDPVGHRFGQASPIPSGSVGGAIPASFAGGLAAAPKSLGSAAEPSEIPPPIRFANRGAASSRSWPSASSRRPWGATALSFSLAAFGLEVRFRSAALSATDGNSHAFRSRESGFSVWITRITGVSF